MAHTPKFIFHFLLAVICSCVLGTLLHSQLVLLEFADLGLAITTNDRISITIDNTIELLPTYIVIIFISLLTSLFVVSTLFKNNKNIYFVAYLIVGAMTMLFITSLSANVSSLEHGISTQTIINNTLHCFTGALAGSIYAYLTKPVTKGVNIPVD